MGLLRSSAELSITAQVIGSRLVRLNGLKGGYSADEHRNSPSPAPVLTLYLGRKTLAVRPHLGLSTNRDVSPVIVHDDFGVTPSAWIQLPFAIVREINGQPGPTSADSIRWKRVVKTSWKREMTEGRAVTHTRPSEPREKNGFRGKFDYWLFSNSLSCLRQVQASREQEDLTW